MRERAADGGDVAHAHVGQRAQRARDHRPALAHRGRALERARASSSRRCASSPDRPRCSSRPSLRRLTRRVRAQHAGLHHQHERGAAGERPRALVVEQRDRFLQGVRLRELERCHRRYSIGAARWSCRPCPRARCPCRAAPCGCGRPRRSPCACARPRARRSPADPRLAPVGALQEAPAGRAAGGRARRRAPAAARASAFSPLLTRLASSNSTATASGVPKSSSIAALKRLACGSFQSTVDSAPVDVLQAPCRAASAPPCASSRCASE